MPSQKSATKSARATPTQAPQVSAASALGRGLRETFADFFADPSRDKLRALLKNGGEMRQLDFKAEWPRPGALAKHVLALGNSGGGCLVVGVSENDDKTLEPAGLSAFKDNADLINGLKGIIPNALLTRIDIIPFHFEASEWAKLVGRKFQVMLVAPDADHLPYVAVNNGEDLQAGVIYVRREGGTNPATHEEIQRLINARIEGGRPTTIELDLKDHLEQLKVLYAEIPRSRFGGLAGSRLAETLSIFIGAVSSGTEPNPKYPDEDFDDFVVQLIAKKKRRIAGEIDVSLD